jgi:protein-L-isoaspartate O-methyltransferase
MLTLTGTLDRTTYTEVDKVLKELGGKWSRGKKAHIFESDPTDEIQAVLRSREVMLLSKNGFYPTPRELTEYVVGCADIENGQTVLEPSAGNGGLACVVREMYPEAKLTVVEIQPKLVATLKAKGFNNVTCADFLRMTPEPIYDRIVMNPPFEQQADCAHIMHAFRFLKPGGRMAAIGGGSWEYRQDRKAKEFRAFLDEYCMMKEPNPAGSFKSSGTMVNTMTLVLWKPTE